MEEPRKPTHSLAHWRDNHSYQSLQPVVTLEERVQDLQGRISYCRKIEKVLRDTNQIERADKKLAQLRELEQELEALCKNSGSDNDER